MKIKILSSYQYDGTKNYGDCIIIDTSSQLIIYDCGSEEFADEVLKYMDEHNYSKADIIVSHNDSDHIDGVMKLVESKKVSSIITLLLLKYLDEIDEKIDDARKSRESIKKQIIELYSNISELSGNNLRDAFEEELFINNNVKIVGPSKEYFIEAVSKQLDTRESDSIDGETIMNAISLQLEIDLGETKVLLTGDSNFEAIKDKIRNYDIIQLPHHGKDVQAEEIFAINEGRNAVEYLVSDNTENSNGGSDNLYKLPTSGYRIKNTKDGIIEINRETHFNGLRKCGNLGNNEIYNIKKNDEF